MRFCLIFVILSLLYSCSDTPVNNDTPVVRVFDTDLMSSEVKAFIPSGTTPEDSLLMAQSYIRNWITKKLLVHKAIENLSEEDKNIQKQVEEYRTSLLIHQYKQKLIEQKIQTEIDDSNVLDYYEKNKDNFILATPIVKAVFFIIPKSASNLKDVRKWFNSSNDKDFDKLEEYCITAAKKYDNFNNKWIELKYILNLMPGDINAIEKEALYSKNIEKEDANNYYFLKITNIDKDGTIAPIEYVRDEITLILKNKKKLQFENELEKQINEEATEKNYVKMY